MNKLLGYVGAVKSKAICSTTMSPRLKRNTLYARLKDVTANLYALTPLPWMYRKSRGNVDRVGFEIAFSGCVMVFEM